MNTEYQEPGDLNAAASPQTTQQLLHDLQVHQIELELQNEELRRTQPDMPESAIASGCIDFVLSPEDIAREIVRIARVQT